MMTTERPIERLLDLYRTSAGSRSALALVLANAIPLVGVLFFGWSLWTILVLYWVENGIVGAWTIPKILLARGLLGPGASILANVGRAVRAPIANAALATFFVFHYGIFWVVHGVFVFTLPAFVGSRSLDGAGTVTFDPATGIPIMVPGTANPFGEIAWSSVFVGAVALVLSHGASFLLTYMRGGEYLRTSAAAQMAAPYGRVVVLHLTILLGGVAIAFVGAPIAALVVLVVLKTLLDLRLHLRAHWPAPTGVQA